MFKQTLRKYSIANDHCACYYLAIAPPKKCLDCGGTGFLPIPFSELENHKVEFERKARSMGWRT